MQCEKRDLRGHKKAPPPQQKRSLDAVRPRVPVTLWHTKMPTKSLKRGHLKPPAQDWAVPWESFLRGVGKSTRRVSETTPGPSRKGVAAQQNTRGKKPRQEKEAQKNPCRLASREKGLRRFKENPKNARGPEWHPEKPPRSRTHGQNGRNKKAAGHKQEKEPATPVRVRGCPVTT